jgi:NAD(P)-dependent dehydrogenase (short-subunit alcohol dehydrogenase family)
MAVLEQSMKRSLTAALMVGLTRSIACFSSNDIVSIGKVENAVPFPGRRVEAFHRLFSTSFSAPEPPQSKGYNIYGDIDLRTKVAKRTTRNTDPDAVFVVTGANRGIGLQFVKKLLQHTKGTIVACCRSPENAVALQDLTKLNPGRLVITPLDLENQESIERAAAQIKEKFDRVDILLNVAGLLGDAKTVPGPERSVSKIERYWMEKSFQVNVFGPVMFSKELVPLMAQNRRPVQKKDHDSDDQDIRPKSVIANLSARVGSISDNGLGGWYSYRMSKAALNQATRTLANELKRQSIWCIALHPGTTDTDLSKPFQKNVQEGRLFPVDFTVDSLMKVIDSMDDENSGGLYDWAGKAIPF